MKRCTGSKLPFPRCSPKESQVSRVPLAETYICILFVTVQYLSLIHISISKSSHILHWTSNKKQPAHEMIQLLDYANEDSLALGYDLSLIHISISTIQRFQNTYTIHLSTNPIAQV